MSNTPEVRVSAEEFPKQLRELRKQKSLTQKELAEKSKVSQQTISAIENGTKEPSLRILTSIAIVLGVVLLIGLFSKKGEKTNEQ